MSDYVKEAAPSRTPFNDFSLNPDLANSSVNRRRLVALSAQSPSIGGLSGDPSSFLGDAFADVFASMAAAAPPAQPSQTSDQDASASDQESIDSPESTPSSQQDRFDESSDASGLPVVSGNSEDRFGDHRNQDDPHGTGKIKADGERDADLNADSPLSVKSEYEVEIEGADADADAEGTGEANHGATDEQTDPNTALVVAVVAASPQEDPSQSGDSAQSQDPTSNAASTLSSAATETAKPTTASTEQTDAGADANQFDDANQSADDGTFADSQQSSDDSHAGNQDESRDRRRYSSDEKSGNQPVANGLAAKSKSSSVAPNGNLSIEAAADRTNGSESPLTSPVSPSAVRETTASATIIAVAGTVPSSSSTSAQSAVSGTNRTAGAVSGTNATASGSLTPSDSVLPPGPNPSNRPDAAAGSKQGKGSGEAATSTDMLTRIKLVQRVSRAFQHLGPEGGVVRLRLAPAELGTVRVEMQIQNKKVEARVVTETEAASQALREHLPELRTRLESYGLQVERLDVETESDGGASLAGNQQSQDESNQQRRSNSYRNGSRETHGPSQPAAAAIISSSPSLSQNGGVDIHV